MTWKYGYTLKHKQYVKAEIFQDCLKNVATQILTPVTNLPYWVFLHTKENKNESA